MTNDIASGERGKQLKNSDTDEEVDAIHGCNEEVDFDQN